MSARFLGLCVALALLAGAAGASAQCSYGRDGNPSLFMLNQKVVAHFKQQAAGGNAAAQCNLGMLYYTGEAAGWGVPKDFTQAVLWLRKSAEQGNDGGQLNLAYMYHYGDGVPRDDARAAFWWRKAADQGDADAQYNLGLLYYSGDGVPQDFAESYFWLDVALPGTIALGSNQKLGRNARDAAAAKLTPSVLLQTQERARKWFEDHPARPR